MRLSTPTGIRSTFEKVPNWDNKYPNVSITLFDLKSNIRIGYLDLERTYNNKYITHSSLDPKYRGKGIGLFMYIKALRWCLKNNHRVTSSGGTSSDAQRVWRSKTLRKHFTIKVKYISGQPTWYVYKKNDF